MARKTPCAVTGEGEERLPPDGLGELLDEIELVLGRLQRLRAFEGQLHIAPEGLQARRKPTIQQPRQIVQQAAEALDLADEDRG